MILGGEEKLQDQISELTKTISQQTRLLEHHQKEDTVNTDSFQKKPSNKVLATASNELSTTFKFAGFASTAMIVLLILAYSYQDQNEKLPQQKTVSSKKYQLQKKKSPTRTVKSTKKEFRNYTPIPK
ncbi:hypothetical protein D5R40_34560 [Okeania hirsuta]|uniref:Uncharacterized protein n=1 Tax=Okeania hirsuta TaxID=1458930 RepID=A0A3N6NC25_9CYAN|nr:hypothetical protein [Okeania hirsuta]RQH13419.1 hypothetical protein D5R40_34560 [Okeania hirsuta]